MPFEGSHMHVTKKIAGLLVALPVSASIAATYYSVVPLPGRETSIAPKPEVVLTLDSSALPTGVEDEAYQGFDFNQVLSVTGAAYQKSDVLWSMDSVLPAGLVFNNGVLTGTPTTPTTGDGTEIQVTAAYKDKQVGQAYKLAVEKGSCKPGQVEYRSGGFGRFTMPKYCTKLEIKAWGAAGGKAVHPTTGQVAFGGGGGAVRATFRIQPGTALTAATPVGRVTSYGSFAGGNGINTGQLNNYGGAAAAVYQGSTLLVVAGGGGGGSFTADTGQPLPGVGGGSLAAPRSASGVGGHGATVNGAYLGAGGGGYPNGGGRSTGTTPAQGGASSYVSTTGLILYSESPGEGTAAGNVNDPDNGGAGIAEGGIGYVGTMGGIVLKWSE